MEAAIELTAAERDLLWQIWNLNCTSVGEEIAATGSARQLDAAVSKARLYVRLLSAVETGTLEPPDDEAVALVREHRTGTLEILKRDQVELSKLRAGDMDYCGIGMTPLESEQETVTLIDRELDEVVACDSFLSRVGGR